jgi:tetratricopeptide (TPR) repeat protein
MLNEQAFEQAFLRFAVFYASRVQVINALYFDSVEQALHMLNEEFAQIQQGRDWSVEHAADDTIGRLLCDYASLHPYLLDLNLTPTEKRQWYEHALDAARRLGDVAARDDLYCLLGDVHVVDNEYDIALDYFHQARQSQDLPVQIRAGTGIARVYLNQGEMPAALEYAQAAYDSLQPETPLAIQSNVHGVLIEVYYTVSNFPAMIPHTDRLYEIATEIQDQPSQIRAMTWNGIAAYGQDEYERAFQNLTDALDQAREIASDRLQLQPLIYLAAIHIDWGSFDQAETYSQQARHYAQKLNDRRSEAMIINNQARIADFRGDTEQAFTLYAQGMTLCEQIDDRVGYVIMSIGYASNGIILQHYEESRQTYQDALKIAEEINDSTNQSQIHMGIGDIDAAQKNYTAALASYRAALEILQDHQIVIGEGVVLRRIGQVLGAIGDLEASIDHLTRSLKILLPHKLHALVVVVYEQLVPILRQVDEVTWAGRLLASAYAHRQSNGSEIATLLDDDLELPTPPEDLLAVGQAFLEAQGY